MTNMTVIKNLNDITNRNIDPAMPLQKKIRLVYNNIDTSKWDFIGFVDRSNNFVAEPRFHNIRNASGRFAKVKQR